MDLGTRGNLLVVQNLETGDRVSAYKQTLMDRVMNRFDGGEPETEVGGGIMFFKTDGMGKETRFSPNADIGENIDNLMGTFDATKATQSSIVNGVVDLIDWSNNAYQMKDQVKEAVFGGVP